MARKVKFRGLRRAMLAAVQANAKPGREFTFEHAFTWVQRAGFHPGLEARDVAHSMAETCRNDTTCPFQRVGGPKSGAYILKADAMVVATQTAVRHLSSKALSQGILENLAELARRAERLDQLLLLARAQP